MRHGGDGGGGGGDGWGWGHGRGRDGILWRRIVVGMGGACTCWGARREEEGLFIEGMGGHGVCRDDQMDSLS